MNLLNEVGSSKFVTGQGNVANDHQMWIMIWEMKLSITLVLKSNLCDYNDA